jgi:predicted DsbA family dithiol-disulfide isomerase
MQRQFGAEIDWLPYELHPEYPPEGIERAVLRARFGDDWEDRLRLLFEQNGFAYSPPAERVPSTRLALEVGEQARAEGLTDAYHRRLMAAYWQEAREIGDEAVVRELALEVGVSPAGIEDALSARPFGRVLDATRASAVGVGIDGIPAFLLDRSLLVVGAHSHETFERAFAQLADARG